MHTDHCNDNGNPCMDSELAALFWNQPPGIFVDEAAEVLGEEMPWCEIAERAHYFAAVS